MSVQQSPAPPLFLLGLLKRLPCLDIRVPRCDSYEDNYLLECDAL